MVGCGGDTYDPTCELPKGHDGWCKSTSGVGQHKRAKPERVVEDAIRAAVGGPEYVARIVCEDLRAAGLLHPAGSRGANL